MPDAIEILRRRWHELLPAEKRPGTAAAAAIDELIAAYTGPDRQYHDARHIAALLALSAAEADRLADHASVDLAIFYHDAVYAPRAKDNETASAELARRRLTVLGVSPAQVDRVAGYIEATAHMAVGALHPDPDLARLLDLDLAVLAAPAPDYDAYAAAIRREYAHVPEPLYCTGRVQVLATFLARARLYRCDDHHVAWTEPARANLRREIARLEGTRR